MTLVGLGVSVQVGGGRDGAVTVITALADFVASVTLVALMVTAAGLGKLEDAVYVTETPESDEPLESVPHVAPLHPEPERVHVTPACDESLRTVGVNG